MLVQHNIQYDIWFAWRPVKTTDGGVVWLTWVKRVPNYERIALGYDNNLYLYEKIKTT